MISALKNGEVDVVVALTEGLVKDITTTDSPIRLLGTYVESPLCWAISSGFFLLFYSFLIFIFGSYFSLIIFI